MSELSPLDILGKKFAIKFRGYPANEVHEYLTEIAGAMEGLTRERGELRQQVHQLGGVDAQQLPAHPRGVGERAQDIEQRAHPQLAAGPDRIAHGAVVSRCEHEAETDFVNGAAHLLGTEIQGHAQ